MSENLDIRARLTAVNEMSPILRAVLSDLKKFESTAKRVNAQFATMGRAGTQSLDMFARSTKTAEQMMRGMANTAKSASRDYAADWKRATDQRLAESRRMYSSLSRMESDYRRQLERQAAAERRAERSASRSGGLGRLGAGRNGRIPAPRLSTVAIGGGLIGAGVASVLRKRMEVQAAEVRSQMFGDLNSKEVQDLRRGYADRAGIRYGVGTSKALDVATEGLKAGIPRKFAADFGDLALKAQAGLDIPVDQTAKLMGRLSSQMAFNKERYNQILNAIAVANNDTAADGKEIVDAMRRGLSALATTKMTPEQLAALTGTEVSLGIQPFKAGTFTSFLTSQIAGADSARGQNAKDLGSAANALGFGNRAHMAAVMRSNPMETIQKILDALAKMPEKLRTKVAKQLGGKEWMDELLTLVLGRDKLRDIAKDVVTKQGFLDKVALQKIRSMQGRWASIVAAFGLVWEKIGAGFETMFNQVSDAILDYADKFNFDSIMDHVSALTDGLRDGLGLKSWGDMIKSIAGQFDASTVEKWRNFGKGFGEVVLTFANGLKAAFKVLGFFVGGSGDGEGLGKLTAWVTGLGLALTLLAPTLVSLEMFAGIFTLLAGMPFARMALGFLALCTALKKTLDYVSDKIFAVFVSIVDAVKNVALSMINHVRSWIGLAPIGGSDHGASGSWEDSGSVQKQSFLGPSKAAGAWFRKASLIADGNGALPNILGSDGVIRPGIVNPKNVPSFSGNGGSALDTMTGAGLTGNAFLQARRAKFAEEMQNDPTLRLHLAAMQMTEGASKGGTIESLMNRADMQGKPLRQMLGYTADGRINPKSFYGPIRRGKLGPAIEYLKRHPKEFAKYDAYTSAAIAGSHVIGGYTDQGLPTDPNGSARTGIPGLHLRDPKTGKMDGNEFTDWAGAGRQKAIQYRHLIEKGIAGSSDNPIGNVPTPSQAISNVPLPRPIQGGGTQVPNGGGGPVTIHVHGGSHDPEAIATLVQRRIDESMNWRTHDTASEYT